MPGDNLREEFMHDVVFSYIPSFLPQTDDLLTLPPGALILETAAIESLFQAVPVISHISWESQAGNFSVHVC